MYLKGNQFHLRNAQFWVLLCSLGIKQSKASRYKARHKIISAVAFVIILVESPCLGNITDAMTQHLSEDECDL